MAHSHATDEDNVATESVEYKKMAKKWDMLHKLLGGTQAMRDAGRDFLPKTGKAEDSELYRQRLDGSFLYGAFADTIERLSSKPFAQAINIPDNIPDSLKVIENDVDRTGKNITQLGREEFIHALVYGKAHTLVDFPINNTDQTMADEMELGVRPLIIPVAAPNLIFWTADNNQQLTQIRIRETAIVSVGTYGNKVVERIRVITPHFWELHEKRSNGKGAEEWTLILDGENTLGKIPLETAYIKRTGFLTADPPLEDLAWLNIAHWQSSSDQKNILHRARVPLLAFFGFTQEEIDKGVVLGPSQSIFAKNSAAYAKYIEIEGKAIEEGAKEIAQIEERMEVLGLQPLIKQTARATATGKVIDEMKTESEIQAWIRGIESLITNSYGLASEWLKAPLPKDFKADIFNDFGITGRKDMDLVMLREMRKTNDITQETLLIETKRRGVLRDSFDVKNEILETAEQGPPLGLITSNIEDENEDENVDVEIIEEQTVAV